ILSEGHPKPVNVADDELPHSVKGVMKAFDYFNSVLQTLIKNLDIVGINVQVDFASTLLAWLAARTEHDLAFPERETGKTKPIPTIVERIIQVKADTLIPIDS